MKCDELKPLVFSLKDFAYIEEPAAEKNFENPHDHAVYKATEVDAAIAELKNKIEDVQASAYEMKNELNWNKYKRCLAMAKWCLREYLNCYKYKITFWLKWRKRWLELAEVFK